ncbi:ABC transporter permease [Embleya hyalina]|uniref:ABC transporter permease n=1 Tax=Embleya hyalina TaxID=516124 RepID=A0A401YR28_9ACTN|nr:FtsX-like permease family protein [Embleya hyalina]GCD97037.1 ABC transporter permease [Embleya hyalina]
MNRLARLTLRARAGQVLALAVTVFFSAVLMGAFGVLLETGVRGRVSTGEYDNAPLLVASGQSVPVRDDVDLTVPDRALLPASLVDEIAAALPTSRVVADRIVPAVLATRAGDAEPVDAHPWSAFALGNRELASGRAPVGPDEIVLPGRVARSHGLAIGGKVSLGFGDRSVEYTLAGTTTADDTGVDAPDVYLSDEQIATRGAPDRGVAVIGVWPRATPDERALARLVPRAGARLWDRGARGPVEAVSQGRATAALVSVSGALGAVAFIVAVFTVIALTSLQIRERSSELAMLRIVGATPRQVKRLLRAEIRVVAASAAGLGGLVGPLVGAAMIGAIRSWGVLPRTLEPVFGPFPFIVAMLTGFVAAEIAVRVAVRRVVRDSPLAQLEGGDTGSSGSPRSAGRVVVGVLLLAVGIVMALAPTYTSNVDVAGGLPGISGLVMALSIGPLSPQTVRAATAVVRRPAVRSAAAYMALGSIRHRAARVGGALTPIVLGVALAAVQLSGAATAGAVSEAQAHAGARTDLTVTVSRVGVGDRTTELVRGVPGVGSVTPFVSTGVIVRPPAGSDNSPQALKALGIAADQVERYADLRPTGGGAIRLREGDVVLGVLGAAQLGAHVGDEVTVVLADGRSIRRHVSALYERGLGFGEVLLPLGDLRPATASGLVSGLAVTVVPASASVAQVERRIRDGLADVPGAEVTRSGSVDDGASGASGASGGEDRFGLLILVVLFGYIAIAVTNSLVTATLSRRSEFALLAVVGATPRQRRSVLRWEAAILGVTACVVGTGFALPGLFAMTYALSNGDRIMPAIDPFSWAGIVAFTFVLVFSATALAGRAVMRDRR